MALTCLLKTYNTILKLLLHFCSWAPCTYKFSDCQHEYFLKVEILFWTFQIFRPDGSFVCIVGFSEPIKRPSDIHLTKDGHLVVVNFIAHQLKVYKLGDS